MTTLLPEISQRPHGGGGNFLPPLGKVYFLPQYLCERILHFYLNSTQDCPIITQISGRSDKLPTACDPDIKL
ncbi:hypothetical protein, partial [Acetobacter nitrogenifigens]|uniref:hypothetical protein n=1 Tax=Acetobacter nitrogenifigens TaxID=285268 RepID=UPI001C3FA59C